MSYLYHTFFFDPLYNLFILLFTALPWADAGVIVVLLTVIVRLILFPLSRRATITQLKMNELAPELESIKEKYKDQSEEQARQTLALYQKKGVNPFSGLLMLLIQFPIIIAIYRIFLHLPQVSNQFLYSFVHAPSHLNTTFLGLIDISGKSLIIALVAAATSYFQLKLVAAKPTSSGAPQNELVKNMQNQSKYLFPIIMFFIAYKTGVVGLYFLTTNIFSIAQELYIKKHLRANPI